MAKTHKRRAARVARQAAVACARATAWTSRAAAAALFTNHDWKQLTDALDGLLRIEFPSPFTDLQELCPAQAWLVVDLSYVRVNASAASSLRHGIARVVAALETVCVHAETLRPYEDLYAAFWTRVLSSDMNQDVLKEDDKRITDLIRFQRVKGTHLALRWHGRRLQPVQVVAPLQRLMSAVAGASPSTSYVSVQLALRLEDCQLTTADIKSIHELLKMSPSSSSDGGCLCQPTILKELSLWSSALYPHHLNALIALLEDPTTRRIDSLCLDDTTPHDVILPHTYPAIFQLMLSTALRFKASPPNDISDDGLRLSFDKSRHLDAHLIEAIENALLQATRRVSTLSLACVQPPNFGALMRLTRLILTPLPTATEDFELDLSCVNADGGQDDMEEAVFVSLAEMVTEAIPRIYSAGLVASENVTCRLLYPEIFEDQFLNVPVRPLVSTLTFYDVLFVTHNGFFQIALPEVDDRGRHLTGWVSSTAIASIRVGDRFIVGSNCTKLILDCDKHTMTGHSSDRLITAMAATTGACLKHLSLRGHPRSFAELPAYMGRCPNLLELNASFGTGYYGYYKPIWPESPADTGPLLQVLDVSNCHLDAASLKSLTPLPSLRCLRLADNNLKGDALEVVLERMRTSRTLEVVTVTDTAPRNPEDEQRFAAVQVQVEKHLRDAYVTPEARGAFLSVLARMEDAGRLRQCVPVDTLATIFRFAGTRPSCVVCW